MAAVARRCRSDSSETILTGKLLYKIYGWQGPAARAAGMFGRAVGPGEFDRCPGVSKNTGSAKKLLDRFA
ncbi:MAG: hypothetical protein AMJ79_00620 [Phycisphaerae bacterium SM23_30]|nr:MAG: hypothetical protein AMJ79_00620 [Phycisphaerae bacterium SM23_30]